MDSPEVSTLSISSIKEMSRIGNLGDTPARQKSRTEMLLRVNNALKRSLTSANELMQMIDHFNRTAGKKRAEIHRPAVTILADLVNRVLSNLKHSFPLNKITILKIIPRDLSPLPIAEEHFQTILIHILQFVRHELGRCAGIVTIEASSKIRSEGKETGREYHDVRISYTSPEMVLGTAPNIFDPFQDGTDSEKSARFGVFVAKKLIEHHHGTINLKAGPKNIAFIIEFPAA